MAWKTIKDYMETKGVIASFPRDVLKQAFHHGVLEDGDLWAEMLNKRNEMAHIYDEEKAAEAVKLIRKNFVPALAQVFDFFKKEMAK